MAGLDCNLQVQAVGDRFSLERCPSFWALSEPLSALSCDRRVCLVRRVADTSQIPIYHQAVGKLKSTLSSNEKEIWPSIATTEKVARDITQPLMAPLEDTILAYANYAQTSYIISYFDIPAIPCAPITPEPAP
jgi:hypothetical protein